MPQRVQIKVSILGPIETTSANFHVERIVALAEHNRIRFGTLKAIVEKYLDKCGRQWVAMDSLFGKLGFTA